MRFSRLRPVWAAYLLLEAAGGAASTAEAAARTKNVAIIGAGAAGSTAAYYLRQFGQEEDVAVNITVFEKTDHIGGRTITVNAFDDPLLPIELGASIFVKVNHVMYNASLRFNFTLGTMTMGQPDDITAIWDGTQFTFQTTDSTPWLWQAAKMIWRYGISPYRATKLVDDIIGRFLKLYESPYFPFRSLNARVHELELVNATALTGEQLLAQNKIDAKYCREIIQAATRVNYASNLNYIHGLETLVSLSTDGAVSVEGGNWKIFHRMIEESKAALYRNTSITTIAYSKKKQQQGDSNPKYLLSTRQSSSPSSQAEEYPIEFDDVIIASPWQFSGIEAAADVMQFRVEEIPYTKLHVTLFASPLKLRAGYFKLEPGSKTPSSVYTTLAEGEEPKLGADGVGSTGFYSINALRTGINPKTQKEEYIYKIFSPAEVTPDFLSDILDSGAQQDTSSDSPVPEGQKPLTRSPLVSWYHPHWFYSYPMELPRVTFQDPVLGNGLYYTSGIESFISTMETSALMGMNVARLIIDDVTGARKGDITPDSAKPADEKESDKRGEL